MDISVLDILDELEATPGRNDKEEILESHVKNKLLKRIFVAAQDPYTVYYVSKFKCPKALPKRAHDDDVVLDAFLHILSDELATRNLTGNDAKGAIEQFFAALDARQQKWCERILIRNMRCGVQTTVDRIWPGAIKTFAVALAATLKSEFVKGEGIKILEEVSYPVRVEPKLDGLRCIAVKKNGKVTMFTRNGSVLETLPKIKAALEASSLDNFVLDGEGMAGTKDWNTSVSVMMSSKTKKDDSEIVYNVFDAMYLDAWVEQACDMKYSERVRLARSVITSLKKDAPVTQVPHIMAKDEKELKVFFSKCLDEGFEGVMLKTLDTPYKFKRSKNILKLKPCMTHELVVVGTYEGRRGTRHEGLFGGFEAVASNGIMTRIGGGFNDKMRAEIQIDPESYIGKIVECECQPDPMTTDGLTVDGKLRFPVFCRFRDAKDVDKSLMNAFKAYKKGAK